MNPNSFHRGLVLVALITATVGFVGPAYAQAIPADGTNAADAILNPMVTNFAAARGTIITAVTSLFYSLALIEFVFSLAMLALRSNQADLGAFASFFVQRLLVVGVFFVFLTNGWRIAELIIESALWMGNQVTGVDALNPADVMNKGLSIATQWFNSQSSFVFNLISAIGISMSIVFVMLMYLLLAGQLVMVLGEVYILLLAGLFLMGFGGASWTRDVAINYFRWTLGAALKLLVLNIIMALGFSVIDAWTVSNVDALTVSVPKALTLGGSLLLVWALSKHVPQMTADMVRGYYTGGNSHIWMPLTQSVSSQLPSRGSPLSMAGSTLVGAGSSVAAGATAMFGGRRSSPGSSTQAMNSLAGNSNASARSAGGAASANTSTVPGPAGRGSSTQSTNSATRASGGLGPLDVPGPGRR